LSRDRARQHGRNVGIIRNAVNLRHYQHVEPFIVETGWIVTMLTAPLVASRIKRSGAGTGTP
jgi:hypothetical protein